MSQQCNRCKRFLPKKRFGRKTISPLRYSLQCKDCCNKYNREVWYPKNRQKQIEANRRYRKNNPNKVLAGRYGVEEKEVIDLITRAHGRCEICGKSAKLSLDHDHKTQKIRGFLCNNCNKGIGFFIDDKKLLQKTIDYLSK